MNSEGALAGERILVAAEYIQYGGTRTYFQSLLRFYHRHGAQVVAVTSLDDDDPDMAAFVGDLGFQLLTFRELASRGRAINAPRPTVWSRRAFHREVAAFRELASSFDISRTTVSVGTSGLFMSAAAAGSRPLIIAHGYPHGRRQMIAGRWLMTQLVPRRARIVAVSDYSAARFRRSWNLERREVDVRTVRSTCGDLRPHVPLEARRPLVLTAALVEEYKRPFDWTEIAGMATGDPRERDAQFMWFGEGPLRQQAQEAAARQAPGHAWFPGWDTELESKYDSARVYLQTSSTESLGLAAVDAQRHGLPSVVTDAGGLPEVVIDGVNGFVVPVGDARAAADAVVELLRNDNLWRKQARAAMEVYEERFSPAMWDRLLLDAHR